MRLALTLFLLLFAFICSAQKLIINSGLNYTETSTSMFNPRLGERKENKKSSFAPDINILFETQSKNCLSIKSGFYIHCEYYFFLRWGFDRGTYWYGIPEDLFILNLDIPLLLSYEFGCAKRKVKFHTDMGPYIGFSKHSDEREDQNLKKNDFGWEFMLGIGSEKWQLSSYIRMGLKNMAISTEPFNLEKAHAVIYGCNITRVINLKRKSNT